MKNKVIILLSVLFVFCFVHVSYARDISVYIDNEPLIFEDTKPTIINGRTMVPVRAIFEKLGAQISWDKETKTVTAVKDDSLKVELTVGYKILTQTKNGQKKTIVLDAPATIIDGRTLIPLRAVSNAMDAGVVWHEKGSIAKIYSSDKIYVSEENHESFDPYHVRTSHGNNDFADFSIKNNTLYIDFLTSIDTVDGIYFKIGESVSIKNIKINSVNSFSFPLGNLKEGRNELSIYLSRKGNETYTSYIHNCVYLVRSKDSVTFGMSEVLSNNLAHSKAPVSASELYVSSISEKVENLSNEICSGAKDDYEKLRRIHSWVAENVYYNYDYLNNHLEIIGRNAEEVIDFKTSVCDGYATLFQALANAQGIPCEKIGGFALGLGVQTDWSNISNTNETNHAWNRAYINGRYINIDTTWDSGNEQKQGQLIKKPMRGFLHFDISDVFLAYTHKVVK